jgi:3-hydroxymyristoyl/3-hydroxydecanoyl-(acyl carrier protein) dehydratase
MMDIHAILKQLPHRYPFLLVDKVLELESNTASRPSRTSRSTSLISWGISRPPCDAGGADPGSAGPGGGLLAFDAMGQVPDENNIYYFVGIDGARFKRPVEPGDQLILEITIDRVRGGIWKFKGVARVGEEVACEAELMCTMRSRGLSDAFASREQHPPTAIVDPRARSTRRPASGHTA